MEETDIRSFEGRRLPMRPDIVVIDVSFISLKAVLPVALSLAAAPTHLLALIKPQFEAPRKHSKRGIIRNAMVHQEICDDIAAFASSLGCTGIEVFPSSITGGDGNIEFFIGARRAERLVNRSRRSSRRWRGFCGDSRCMCRTRLAARQSRLPPSRPCRSPAPAAGR